MVASLGQKSSIGAGYMRTSSRSSQPRLDGLKWAVFAHMARASQPGVCLRPVAHGHLPQRFRHIAKAHNVCRSRDGRSGDGSRPRTAGAYKGEGWRRPVDGSL